MISARRGLIVDEDVAHYDGTTAVVRTEHVPPTRWSSCGGVLSDGSSCGTCRRRCRHSPGFVLRHGRAMLAHTFAGTTVRSMLGLESERDVFDRFRERRRREREAATAVELPAAAADRVSPLTVRRSTA